MAGGLSESFEDFLDYETEVFDEIEDRYSPAVRKRAEASYRSQIPDAPLDSQVEWLESRFYSFLPGFFVDMYENKGLNDLRASIDPLEGEGLDCVHGELVGPDSLERYDAVVLDHCTVFDVLNKSRRQYYSNGRKMTGWEDTLEFIDRADQESEVYVLSDIVRKTDRNQFLGQKEGARILKSSFGNVDISGSFEAPDGHGHMVEDMHIGSEAEDLGENVLIATYDSDFMSAVSHHYDIEAYNPMSED
jgi:hypothetical protein